jgi:glycosyltransferase involved in cell wall biosynthesis
MIIRRLFLPFEDSVVWAWPAYQAAEQILRAEPGPWAVISTFPPVSTHLAALQLRRKYDVQWIADFRDPLAGSPSRKAVAHLAGPLSPKVDAFLERGIFRHADFLIANTDVVADVWRRRYPEAAHKIHHIWNGFDAEEPADARPIPPRPYKVLLHAGTIYQGRHPGLLLNVIDRLISTGRLNPALFRVRLLGGLIPGTIPNPDVLERLLRTGCVELVPSVSRAEAARQTAEADYLLLIDLNDGLQLPSKVFEYIRIGRPILALTGKNSPAARVLEGAGISYSALHPDTSLDDAASQVLRFLDQPTHPTAASRWFTENFDARRRTAQLAALLSGSNARIR